MSKLVNDQARWFQEVAPRDYYNENDLERTIMLYLEVIFPEFTVFPFKQDLINNVTGKGSAADLGMVKSDYSEWYVIEVELGKHTKKEVVTQIETFRNFTPDKTHSDYIFGKRPTSFDKLKLEHLIITRLPQLMVIVNEYKDDWKADLKRLSCKMCIFQIYNDFGGQRMYRLNGEHPFVYTDFCHCKYEKELPYTVKVLRPDFLDGHGIKNGDTMPIEFNGVNYLWQREDAGSEAFLICNNRTSPLDPLSSRYRLNYNAKTYLPRRSKNYFVSIFNWFIGVDFTRKTNTFSFIKD